MKEPADDRVMEERPAGTGGEQRAKRPYQPPRIVSRSALEVIAVACSPHPPGKASLASCALERS